MGRPAYNRKTTEQFITESKQRYKDEFLYDKTVYKDNRTDVILICRIHGEFKQNPGVHLRKSNTSKCKKCRKQALSKTTEQFIEDSRMVHGDKFTYEKTKYVNKKTSVVITCKIHGDYLQNPRTHMRHGCPKCGGNAKVTKSEFIARAIQVHGDLYSYEKTEIINSREKITITCRIHGDFQQSISGHLQGKRCFKCYGNSTKTTENFVRDARKVHGKRYSYKKTNYVNNNTYVTIICRIHGAFEQKPHAHLQHQGCPICANYLKSVLKKGDSSWSDVELKELEGRLYVLELVNTSERFLKVGVTTTPSNRFKHYRAAGYTIKEKSLFINNMYEINLLEKYLLGAFFDFKYEPLQRFCGYTECFKMEALPHILEYLGGWGILDKSKTDIPAAPTKKGFFY